MEASDLRRMTIVQRVEWVARTLQVWLFRATGGRVGGRVRHRPVLLLTTTGRKSGRARTLPVVYLPLEDGSLLVAGSNFKNREHDPAWLLNLRANARVDVQIGTKVRPHLAEVLPSGDREVLWARYVAAYPNFDVYQRRTRRTIPLIRLRPA